VRASAALLYSRRANTSASTPPRASRPRTKVIPAARPRGLTELSGAATTRVAADATKYSRCDDPCGRYATTVRPAARSDAIHARSPWATAHPHSRGSICTSTPPTRGSSAMSAARARSAARVVRGFGAPRRMRSRGCWRAEKGRSISETGPDRVTVIHAPRGATRARRRASSGQASARTPLATVGRSIPRAIAQSAPGVARD
jgi:hypothetical protein